LSENIKIVDFLLIYFLLLSGLRGYLDRKGIEKEQSIQETLFRDFHEPLNRIVDDCLGPEMSKDSIRWGKSPQFKCSCDIERVWRALRLLPIEETRSIVSDGKPVEVIRVTVCNLRILYFFRFFC